MPRIPVTLALFAILGMTAQAKPAFMGPGKAARPDLVKDCKSCHTAMPAKADNLNAVGLFLVKKAGKGKVTPEDMKHLKDYK
jgi:hypothetical protein